MDETNSPWIYYEIVMTNLIRRKEKDDHRGIKKASAKKDSLKEFVEFSYKVDLSQLTKITTETLIV